SQCPGCYPECQRDGQNSTLHSVTIIRLRYIEVNLCGWLIHHRVPVTCRRMQDPHGHRISYLRVSITDRCNERCSYCMPQELQEWLPRQEILTYEETLRLIRIAAELGVSKVRITGGEPLTRRDVIN